MRVRPLALRTPAVLAFAPMRHRTPAPLVLVLVLALAGCAWTQYRGNAQRSGVNPYAPGVAIANLSRLIPAWTSADHGAMRDEVVTRDGRAVFAGNTALWALNLNTGSDLWHVDRTNGHQTNGIAAPTTWRQNGASVVGMSQFWGDSIPGTIYFQNIAQLDVLDLATGAKISTEPRGALSPPLDAGTWVYLPQDHLVLKPPSLGGAQIAINVVARALDGSGETFTVPLSDQIKVVSSVAASNDVLYIVGESSVWSIQTKVRGFRHPASVH